MIPLEQISDRLQRGRATVRTALHGRWRRLPGAGPDAEIERGCPNCSALHARGAGFYWQCGASLLPAQPSSVA